jgi:hypothetical protein
VRSSGRWAPPRSEEERDRQSAGELRRPEERCGRKVARRCPGVPSTRGCCRGDRGRQHRWRTHGRPSVEDAGEAGAVGQDPGD